MIQTDCETYEVKIYIGTKEGYTYQTAQQYELTRARLLSVCQNYCNDVGLGLTITETLYVYTDGQEKGFIIGLINYPRFPKPKTTIVDHAAVIARKLLIVCKQERLSIVTPDITYMMEREEQDEIDVPTYKLVKETTEVTYYGH